MKKIRIILVLKICIFIFFFNAQSQEDQRNPPPEKNKKPPREKRQNQYSVEQAISEEAQMHTVAFSGLAFITGSFGADCFFPPGKVADFFGFQYMRDIDKNEMGHNTDFLTNIANNVFHILTEDQLQQLKDLANKQAPLYDKFAYKRMVLIKAFRNQLEGKIPIDKTSLSVDAVRKICSELYEIDAELSYERSIVIGKIISSFNESQRNYLSNLKFDNSSTWPKLPETLDKKSLSHREHVCVMTYASELFSWYAGFETADIYFCPERHGTYFGGFFLKDYPAMGNHGYKISTSLTGDKGKDFIDVLSKEQLMHFNQTITLQKSELNLIVQIRTGISKELRKSLDGNTPDKEKVFSYIKRYGEIDGELSYSYAMCFADIYRTLTIEQKEKLISIRGLDVIPEGSYLFSDKIKLPELENIDFLFK